MQSKNKDTPSKSLTPSFSLLCFPLYARARTHTETEGGRRHNFRHSEIASNKTCSLPQKCRDLERRSVAQARDSELPMHAVQASPVTVCRGDLLHTDPQERAKTTTASSDCRPRPTVPDPGVQTGQARHEIDMERETIKQGQE